MTTLQLNAEIYRAMGVIADDEGLLNQALKYLKKLAAKKQDETLMTKEEFFARVDKARQGKSAAMLPNENLTEFLKRQGYDL
jgi:C4-type Zn-finger protein